MSEEMTCPQCQHEMSSHVSAAVTVHRCTSCRGVFLARRDLANLVEAENDWHADTGPKTRPMPRITADMEVPPPAPEPANRAYIETLFG